MDTTVWFEKSQVTGLQYLPDGWRLNQLKCYTSAENKDFQLNKLSK